MADEKNGIKLWEQYAKKPTQELREKLIIEYANLVKIIAGRMSVYLGYNVEYDDLVGYGVFGWTGYQELCVNAKKKLKLQNVP